MPAISVLVPCYNAEKTLDEALQSMASQTLGDFEIVVVDDGSHDSTWQILTEWAARDRRLSLLQQSHTGIVTALNAGLRICAAPYVARMDADDRSHPERLALQTAYLDQHPDIDLVSCCVAGFPDDEVRQGLSIYLDWLNSLQSNEDIRREIFVESPLPHPSVAFRRQVVLDVGGYQDRGWPEDYDLWLRMYLAGARFAKLPQVLLDWRESPSRLTRTDPRYSPKNFLRLKAYYLAQGPLAGRDAVIIWGAGMMGRRLAKQLQNYPVPLTGFVDVDPRKIGHTRHGLPIRSPADLLAWMAQYRSPVVLAAVALRGGRQIVRRRLQSMGLQEGLEWWSVA